MNKPGRRSWNGRARRRGPGLGLAAIERLEARRLLAAISWDGGGDGTLWSDARNWSTDTVPGAEDDVLIDLAADATILYRGVQPAVRSLTNRETLWVQGSATAGVATLRANGAIDNAGTIRLEAINSTYASTLSVGTTLTNLGTLDVNAGTGGARTLAGALTNHGAVDVGLNATLVVNGQGAALTQAGGSIRADGRLRLDGGTLRYTGGTIAGEVGGNNSRFDVADSVAATATLYAWGAGSRLAANRGRSVTLWVQGRQGEGDAVLATEAGAVNAGTIRLESRDSTYRSNLAAGANALTNTGRIVANFGAGGERRITGDLVNTGSIEAAPSATLDISGGAFELAGGRVDGAVTFANVQVRATASPALPTTLVLVGPDNVLLGDVPPNVVLWVQGRQSNGSAKLTVPGPSTNRGTILLESRDSTYDSDLALGATLTNHGTIDVRAGTRGDRRIAGNLTNRGVIDVAAGISLVIAGSEPVFHQAEGSVRADGSLVLQGGTFRFTGGSVGGEVGGINSQFDVAETVTTASTVYAWGNRPVLLGNMAANATVWVQGRGSSGGAVLTAAPDAVNSGRIRLESRDSTYASSLTVSGGRLINRGIIESAIGTGGAREVRGQVENRGIIRATDGSTLMVMDPLTVDGDGSFSSVGAATIQLRSSLLGGAREADRFAIGASLNFSGAGIKLLEAMGRDLGNSVPGFGSNFTIGSLSLASGATVRLVDQSRNSGDGAAEAVYVDALDVAPGTTLDLNGLKLYARSASIRGNVVGGQVVEGEDGGEFNLGQTLSGRLSSVAEADEWAFFGRAGQQVTLRALTGPGNPAPLSPQLLWAEMTLFGPDGSQVGRGVSPEAGATASIDSISLPADGTYRIRIQAPPGEPDRTGRYLLATYETSANSRPLLLNQTQTGTLASTLGIDRWTFSAAAGRQVRLDVVNVSNPSLRFTLRGPDGSVLFEGTSEDSDLLNLPSSGTYTLSVDALQGQPGSYAFRLAETSLIDLPPGQAFSGQIHGSSHAQLFRVGVAELTRLRVELDDQSNSGQNEIYVKLGSPPTRSDYQYRSSNPAGADAAVLVPTAVPGTWYVLVYAKYAPSPSEFRLSALSSRVLLDRVTPERLGNGEDMTITLDGAGFDASTVVELVGGPGQPAYRARTVRLDQPTRLSATFPAGLVPPGTYSVRVTQPGGHQSTLAGAFTAVAGARAELRTNLITPRNLGFHQPGTIIIEYANAGDVAMPSPLLMLTATQDGRPGALLTLDSSRLIQGFWTSAIPDGFANSVQALASGSTPGLLQPGESGQIVVQYAGWQKPWIAGKPFVFTLSTLTADDDTPIDWLSLKSGLRPSVYSPDAWEPIFANLTVNVGTTWGDYVRVLGENAAYLGGLGQDVSDIGELLTFEVMQANGFSPIAALATARDAFVDTPGLDLSFNRAFGPTLADRNRIGLLGRGWTWLDGWDQTYAILGDGTVVIRSGDGGERRFQPDSRGAGRYFAEPGDRGLILHASSSGLEIREASDLTLRFGADGRIRSMADPNGHAITATYDGPRLMRLTHSSGHSLDLEYNAAGRIRSVTDSFGRATTLTYDPTNQYLLSARDFGGRVTTYTYESTDNLFRRHVLLSVESPSGVRRDFTYDFQGRLASTSGTDGSALTTFLYDAQGRIFITTAESEAAPGGMGTLWLDHRGRAARVDSPLGDSTFASYDRDGNLVRLVDSEGRAIRAAYDARGNLTSATDALGNVTSFAYTGAYARLASFTDALGNVTRYSYDDRGNMLSSTNPDGTVERWTYDDAGNVDTWTNRRGDEVAYDQDAMGRLTTKSHDDGTRVTYLYDAHGNLASTTDATGTTAYSYDLATGFLMRIDYPGGRSLAFTYCTCGRRTSSTDETGYRIEYRYDPLGRLESLTDSAGATLVRYHYDTGGNLARKVLGNGVETTYAYDASGRTLSLVNRAPDGSILSRFSYTYDRRGLRTSMTTLDGRWDYAYDDNGQLTGYTTPDGRQVSYTYDALGNRITETVAEGADAFVVAYTTNDLNQYINVGGDVFAFDADGNLIRQVVDGVVTNYTFDDENRLVRVSRNGEEMSYSYDALGNRIAATRDGETTRFVIDPIGLGNVVGEYDASGQLLARNVYGYGLISREMQAGSFSYYTFDALGNTSELTGAGGGVLNRYAFEPFGESFEAIEAVANPFQFVGEYGVATESADLVFMRARFFQPGLGRFLNADPLRLASGDSNFYRYALNSPAVLIDPTGLEGKWPVNININLDGDDIGDFADWVGEGINDFGNWLGDLFGGDGKADYCVGEGCTLGQDDPKPKPGPPPSPKPRPNPTPPPVPKPTATPVPPVNQGPDGDSNPVGPIDPNEKTGPGGHGPEGFVSPSAPFLYQVDFENLESATAPAQRVDITDELDASLDWGTLEFLQVGFGDVRIDVPGGSQDFRTVVEMAYNGRSFQVEVQLGLDPATGLVSVSFQSVDPATSLPPDALTGFLPPEDGTGRGQGFFTYTIRPRGGLPTGTQIRNVARITFDRGLTISTDQVDPLDASKGIDPAKQALNTIDAGTPTSAVEALPPRVTSPRFEVRWGGHDDPGGSGVASYDVHVSVDGGPFTPWLTATSEVRATFVGLPGRRYAFASVARDRVGLVEPLTGVADATTTVRPVGNDFDGDGLVDPTVFEPSTSTFYVARSALGNVAIQFGIGSLYGGSPVPVIADYDGDGLADAAVFEPSTSTFYVARSALGNVAIQFGIGSLYGGKPAPTVGDYDGDGKSDPAVFEPSTATFYLARSAAGNAARQFGIGSLYGGDPAPSVGDYDGDGKSDPAVFEPSTATFYLARSALGNVARQFGIGRLYGGDPIPVAGDYDGDGKVDPAVFEPSTATFYLSRSTAGNVARQFGIGRLYGGRPAPIPADFDGDGKVDPAVFEPSTAAFYLARSTAGNLPVQFGIGSMYGGNPVPVPADYDGDGRVDAAVFEPSTATFYLARSRAGNVARQFGIGVLYGGNPSPWPQPPHLAFRKTPR